MESFGLKQIIESRTSVTNNSRTLIDHIYCNTSNNIMSRNIPTLGLSDNFTVFVTRKINSLSAVKKSHLPYNIGLSKTLMKTNFVMF